MRARTTGGSQSAPAAGNTGTFGGGPAAVGARPGRRTMQLGDAQYLWILVALELGAIAWLRHSLSRYHGG